MSDYDSSDDESGGYCEIIVEPARPAPDVRDKKSRKFTSFLGFEVPVRAEVETKAKRCNQQAKRCD